MLNYSVLLMSSSVGFRTSSSRTRILPLRLNVLRTKKVPWILNFYSNSSLRFYKSGMTVLEMLIYIEKYNISLPKVKYMVLNFGIVEGWTRDDFEGHENQEADWFYQTSRILDLSIGTSYYDEYYKYVKNVKENNLSKIILSIELFKKYIIILVNKVKYEKIIFIITHENMYKKYTRKSIGNFNNIIKQLSNSKQYIDKVQILEFKYLELYDGIHLTDNSHKIVANKLKLLMNISMEDIFILKKIYYILIEYLCFFRYNKDDFFDLSMKKLIEFNLNKVLKRIKNKFR